MVFLERRDLFPSLFCFDLDSSLALFLFVTGNPLLLCKSSRVVEDLLDVSLRLCLVPVDAIILWRLPFLKPSNGVDIPRMVELEGTSLVGNPLGHVQLLSGVGKLFLERSPDFCQVSLLRSFYILALRYLADLRTYDRIDLLGLLGLVGLADELDAIISR